MYSNDNINYRGLVSIVSLGILIVIMLVISTYNRVDTREANNAITNTEVVDGTQLEEIRVTAEDEGQTEKIIVFTDKNMQAFINGSKLDIETTENDIKYITSVEIDDNEKDIIEHLGSKNISQSEFDKIHEILVDTNLVNDDKDYKYSDLNSSNYKGFTELYLNSFIIRYGKINVEEDN